MELFLTVEGTDGVGILRQRNAMHKIPKFPHVVSHGKREKTHHSRSRATCYVAPSPAVVPRRAAETEMPFLSRSLSSFVFTRCRSPGGLLSSLSCNRTFEISSRLVLCEDKYATVLDEGCLRTFVFSSMCFEESKLTFSECVQFRTCVEHRNRVIAAIGSRIFRQFYARA